LSSSASDFITIKRDYLQIIRGYYFQNCCSTVALRSSIKGGHGDSIAIFGSAIISALFARFVVIGIGLRGVAGTLIVDELRVEPVIPLAVVDQLGAVPERVCVEIAGLSLQRAVEFDADSEREEELALHVLNLVQELFFHATHLVQQQSSSQRVCLDAQEIQLALIVLEGLLLGLALRSLLLQQSLQLCVRERSAQTPLPSM
jgi:hypothetical protein